MDKKAMVELTQTEMYEIWGALRFSYRELWTFDDNRRVVDFGEPESRWDAAAESAYRKVDAVLDKWRVEEIVYLDQQTAD